MCIQFPSFDAINELLQILFFPIYVSLGAAQNITGVTKGDGLDIFQGDTSLKVVSHGSGEVGGYQIKSYMVDYCHNCLFNFVSEVTMAESGFATVSSTHSYLECAYKSPSSPPFRGPPNTLSTD